MTMKTNEEGGKQMTRNTMNLLQVSCNFKAKHIYLWIGVAGLKKAVNLRRSPQSKHVNNNNITLQLHLQIWQGFHTTFLSRLCLVCRGLCNVRSFELLGVFLGVEALVYLSKNLQTYMRSSDILLKGEKCFCSCLSEQHLQYWHIWLLAWWVPLGIYRNKMLVTAVPEKAGKSDPSAPLPMHSSSSVCQQLLQTLSALPRFKAIRLVYNHMTTQNVSKVLPRQNYYRWSEGQFLVGQLSKQTDLKLLLRLS